MISRIQMHNFDLMAWLKKFLKISWLIVEFQSTDAKSIVHWKSQTLTFWSKSSFKDYNSSRHVKMWNLFIKKLKKFKFHFEKSKFLNLEFFLSVGNSHFFHNFEPNLHHDLSIRAIFQKIHPFLEESNISILEKWL